MHASPRILMYYVSPKCTRSENFPDEMNNWSTLAALFNQHVTLARQYESENNVKFAYREWVEASRLRPSCLETKKEVDRIEQIISPRVTGPCPISALRIVSFFNLSLRYWDMNKPHVALREV